MLTTKPQSTRDAAVGLGNVCLFIVILCSSYYSPGGGRPFRRAKNHHQQLLAFYHFSTNISLKQGTCKKFADIELQFFIKFPPYIVVYGVYQKTRFQWHSTLW